MRKRITIKDLARMAGVSVSSVARALNNRPDVAPETRQRILDLAEEVGYVPNALARDLRTEITRSIGMVVSDNSNPFFALLIRGVQDEAIERRFNVAFANSDENYQQEVEAIRFLQELRVSGLLLAPTTDSVDHVFRYGGKSFPLVLVSRRIENTNVNWIIGDDVHGAYLATKHLLDLGHRDIIFVNGPLHISNAQDRLEGYKRALADFKVDYNTRLVYDGHLNAGDGYNTAQKLIMHCKPRAIFCYSDFVAIGVIRALTERKLRVPEQVAVVGYDDIELARYLPVPLTTIRQSAYKLGRLSAKHLIDIIEGKNTETTPFHVLISPELIIRQSTGNNKLPDTGCHTE